MSSIPQRFGRIARHKFNEFKQRIEEMDEAALRELEQEQQKVRQKDDATRELDEALAEGGLTGAPSAMPTGFAPRKPDLPSNPPTSKPSPQFTPRTPDQIAAGVRPNPSSVPPPMMQTVQTADPLAYHYQLLGVENGTDLLTVTTAYNKLAARADPSRFPADSEEAKQATGLRERLDASYKILREALDFTARRFDLLEFDGGNAAPVHPPTQEEPTDAPTRKIE